MTLDDEVRVEPGGLSKTVSLLAVFGGMVVSELAHVVSTEIHRLTAAATFSGARNLGNECVQLDAIGEGESGRPEVLVVRQPVDQAWEHGVSHGPNSVPAQHVSMPLVASCVPVLGSD